MAKAGKPIPGALALSALNEQTQELVERVQATKCPLVITKDGQPAVLLVDAEQYELQQRRLVLLERIARGERDLADGRTYSQEEVEALLDDWLADGK